MLKEILFLSVDQVKKFVPTGSEVVVSVLDLSEEWARPIFSGWKDVLCLSFEDVYEECKLSEPWAWPDEPTAEEHSRFCMGKGERIPTLSDAREIVSFVRRHAECEDEVTLVAHCFGGISRSAAIASWASARFWVPIGNSDMKTTDFANKRLVRLLDKAFLETDLVPALSNKPLARNM